MFDEDGFAMTPVNFFQLRLEGIYTANGVANKKYLLPDTSDLCHEDAFAKVHFGWNEKGLEFVIEVDQPFKQAYYPDVAKGDSVELMIDTRDVKTSGYNTRFCHHFFFLPEALEGIQAGEITKFRTEDKHELCDSNELIVKCDIKSKHYTMKIFIPNSCLVGYDPEQFTRLGFTYRINRYHGEPQHFSVVSQEYQIEQQPSLWSSIQLIKNNQ